MIHRVRMAWIAIRALATRAGVYTTEELKKEDGSDENVRIDVGRQFAECTTA